MATIVSVNYVTNLVSIPTSSSVSDVAYMVILSHVPMDFAMDYPYCNVASGEPTIDYVFHVYYAYAYGFHDKDVP